MSFLTAALPASELKSIAAVLVCCFLISNYRRKAARKRWLGENDGSVDQTPVRVVDHPFVPYVVENLTLVGLVVLARRIGAISKDKPVTTFFTLIARSMIMINGGLIAQKLSTDVLYGHIPFFSTTKPSAELKDIAGDYMNCNFIVDVVMSSLQLLAIKYASSAESAPTDSRFRVWSYLGKFLFARLSVDVLFYIVHRILHTDFAYQKLHRRHHDHTAPRVQTNFHFTVLDITFEALVPILTTQAIASSLGMKWTELEEDLISTNLIYFEGGSHSGKELPTVTWFPPLSPLVDWVTGFDQRLVEYHTKHHMLFNCNYSISPWPDKLIDRKSVV